MEGEVQHRRNIESELAKRSGRWVGKQTFRESYNQAHCDEDRINRDKKRNENHNSHEETHLGLTL
jgi:hypothetical protein